MRAQASHTTCAQHVGVGGAVQRMSAACPLAWTKRPRRQTRCPSPLPGRPAVEDLARSKKFYGEGLGCTIEQDYPNFVSSNLGDGSPSLARYERQRPTMPASPPRGPVSGGLVPLQRLFERSSGRGHRQSRSGRWRRREGSSSFSVGGYFGYFSDPDGYLWKVASAS